MKFSLYCVLSTIVVSVGCQQNPGDQKSDTGPIGVVSKAAELEDDEATEHPPEDLTDSKETADKSGEKNANSGSGMRGSGMRGSGLRGGMMNGPGGMGGMSEDMMTLRGLFDDRDKIRRTIKNLSNGVETMTESDDPDVVDLLQEHVPAMEGRVATNDPLPPMNIQPLFKELIKHSDDFSFEYETTENGIMTTYTSDDPYVVLLIQEHAKLVSRLIKNGMQEIHKPYELPELPK